MKLLEKAMNSLDVSIPEELLGCQSLLSALTARGHITPLDQMYILSYRLNR